MGWVTGIYAELSVMGRIVRLSLPPKTRAAKRCCCSTLWSDLTSDLRRPGRPLELSERGETAPRRITGVATSGKIARAGPRDPSEAIRFCRMCFMTVTIIFSGGSEDTEEKRLYLGVAVVFIQGD